MAFATMQDLLIQCEQLLSEVSGSAVQTYSQDRLASMIQRAFNRVYNDRWWSHLMLWEQLALDGITGRTTTVQAAVDYNDIRAVFRSDWDRQLPQVPSEVNVFRIQGTTPRYIGPDYSTTGRVFKVYPITAVESSLAISYRAYPTSFGLDATIPFDSDVLVNSACWEYTSDDGFNGAQIEKFRGLTETRLNQLRESEDRKPIILDPRINQIPDQWREY